MPEELTLQQQEQQKILQILSTDIGVSIIAYYILQNKITYDQAANRLRELGKNDILAELDAELKKEREKLRADDDNLWSKTIEGIETAPLSVMRQRLEHYISSYPTGFHINECKAKLTALDDKLWEGTLAEMKNKDAKILSDEQFEEQLKRCLNSYLEMFPNGKHQKECRDCLADVPWLKTVQKHTIEAYRTYLNEHPGQHENEAKKAIQDIQDENEWKNVTIARTRLAKKEAARMYNAKFPNGRHRDEAQRIINDESESQRDKIIRELSESPNAYPIVESKEHPESIRKFVENNIIDYRDLEDVFSSTQIAAIQNFKAPTELPQGTPPNALEEGPTEVYFWGTPGSGKTCAMGALLSGAKMFGRYEGCPTPGTGGTYREMLSNIFQSTNICTLPKGTSTTSIQQMIFRLIDVKGKNHLTNFIDLAGELFEILFFQQNNDQEYANLPQTYKVALEKTLGYLAKSGNKKIHFFIVPYGEADRLWKSIPMSAYLECAASYLNQNRVFRKDTTGVYILVTKSDNMPVEKRPKGDKEARKIEYMERKTEAENYVMTKFFTFHEQLKRACAQGHVADFEIIPFSVGDAFAQQLCTFDSYYTRIVLHKLALKIPSEGGWLRRILGL